MRRALTVPCPICGAEPTYTCTSGREHRARRIAAGILVKPRGGTRVGYPVKTRAAALRMIAAGKTTAEVAERYNISRDTIQRWAGEAGLAARRGSTAWRKRVGAARSRAASRLDAGA